MGSKVKDYYKTYFLTRYNIPIKNPPTSINFSANLKKDAKSSILDEYESEIENKVKSAGIESKLSKTNEKMDYISNAFNELLIKSPSDQNIIEFGKIFSLFLTYEKSLINNANILEKILKNMSQRDFVKESIPVVYKNPIQIYNFKIDENFILVEKIKGIINKIPDPRFKQLAINSFNTIYFGNFMDISLPSIGPLFSVFDKEKINENDSYNSKINIYYFLMNILNGKNDFLEHLPLLTTNFEKTLSKLLLKNSNSSENIISININPILTIKEEENRLESVIENSILGIRFTLDDVLREGNKESSKVKPEYVLPYIFKNNKIEKLKDLSEIGDRTKVSSIFEHNRKQVAKILDLYYSNSNKLKQTFKNDPNQELNIKNCLAIYVYISISVYYDIYKYYFDKVLEIINEYIENDRYQIGDVKPAFEYLEKTKKSLYNSKKILENCFYHLFLPSRLTPKYGVKINDQKGFYEIENKLLAPLNTIILNYPFVFKEEDKRNNNKELVINKKYNIDINNIINKDKFINFALSHKNKNDIVNPKEELFVGTFVKSPKTTFDIYFTIFSPYLADLYNQSVFNEILLNAFNQSMKLNIPIEIFQKLITSLDNEKSQISSSYAYSDLLKKNLEGLLLYPFSESFKFSTYFLIQLAILKRDIVIHNKDKYTLVYEYSINSLLFYHQSLVLKYIVEQEIKDDKFKKDLITKMNGISTGYEKEVLKVSKQVQKEVLNAKESKIKVSENTSSKNSSNNKNKKNKKSENINKNKINVLSANQLVMKIKSLISKNNILIPYSINGKVYYISLFNMQDGIEWNKNVNINQSFIIIGESSKNIFNNKYLRVLKENIYNEWKRKEGEEKIKYIMDILTDKERYLESTELINEGKNGEIVNYLREKCNEKSCKQTFISEYQFKKIANIR